MRKLLLIIFTLVFTSFSYSQEVLHGRVLDSADGKALPGVNIYNLSDKNGVITNSFGEFKIKVSKLPILITCSHVGYKTDTFEVKMSEFIVFDLAMIPIKMHEVTIKAIRTVVNDGDIYILDFEIAYPNLIVLGYSERANKSSLFLVDSLGDTLCRTAVKGKYMSLDKDCMGNVLLVNEFETSKVIWDKNSITVAFMFYKNNEGLHLNCNCLLRHKMITSFHVNNQVAAFAEVGLKDSVFRYFRVIDNRNVYNMPENWGITETGEKSLNISYLNTLDGKKIAFNRDNTVLFHPDLYTQSEAFASNTIRLSGYSNKYISDLFFFKNVIDKPIYVPIFYIGKELFLFNHVEGVLEVYNENLEMIDRIKIDYHTKPYWKPILLYDEISHKLYTVYENGGKSSLAEINPGSGKIIKTINLPFAFVSEIKVNNGRIYFLYKEQNNYSTQRLVKKLFSIKA